MQRNGCKFSRKTKVDIRFYKLCPSQRTSLGATLLSPVSQLALGTIGRSRSLINQSQESLDPCDHYEHSDREEGEEPHQQDADDEDDSGLVSQSWQQSSQSVTCLDVNCINTLTI